jgi:hypothetical protein
MGPVPYWAKISPEMKDRAESLLVTSVDRGARVFAVAQLFPNALVDEHVGVDGDTYREGEPRDTGERHRRAETRQHGELQQKVEEHGSVGDRTRSVVVDDHEDEHEHRAHERALHALRDGVLTE